MWENKEYYNEIKPKNVYGLNIRELTEYKELFYFFTWRDIKVKYKQTFLGFLWAILQPLIMMLIFTFLLGRTFKIPSDGIPYPLFAFSGLLLWTVFSSGITNSGNSMIINSHIIKKIYFPRLIIPVSSILVSVFDFLMSLLIFFALLIYFHQPVNWLHAVWCWPTGLFLTIVGTMGPGCLLAALNIKYRDFRYVIPFLVQVLFFLTPVIYPVSVLTSATLKYLLVISPMYTAIELFRFPMTGAFPDTMFLTISILSSLLLLIIGFGLFYKN